MKESQTLFGLSENKACKFLKISKTSYRYDSVKDDSILRSRMKELAQEKRRYGCPRLHFLLKKEGLVKNHKRTERIYREEKLSLRTKKRKKIACQLRVELPRATAKNQTWAMDFVSDSLASARKLKCLTIIDVFNRESLAIFVDHSITGHGVVNQLNLLKHFVGLPNSIMLDNGPEFTSKAIWLWAYENNVKLSFSEPGKPTDNAFIESFNGRFRDECLNEQWFLTLSEARKIIEVWRVDYNENRPHSSLGMLTPLQFTEKQEVLMLTA